MFRRPRAAELAHLRAPATLAELTPRLAKSAFRANSAAAGPSVSLTLRGSCHGIGT